MISSTQIHSGHAAEFDTKLMKTCGTTLAVQDAYQVRVNFHITRTDSSVD